MANHNEKSSISLDELSTNESAKRALFESIAAWLVDSNKAEINLIGTKQQIAIVRTAMIETKKFQDELSKSNSTLVLIEERLRLKSAACHSFEDAFGTQWLL